ncbi:MAG: hypothetical protein ACSLFK_03140 [Gemmatimonadaceae bacterium]
MNKIFTAAAVAAALTLGANVAQAQDFATQEVSFEVTAINSLSVSGTPSLVIVAALAGVAPTNATASGTYAITTNEANRKIIAQLDADMPSGLTLSVLFGTPEGASASSKVLSTGSEDVATAISTLNEAGLSIGYTLAATAAAGVVAEDSRTVTYTIVAGA